MAEPPDAANEGLPHPEPAGASAGTRGRQLEDREMLEWATAADGFTLALLVDHDDAEREFLLR